jgi:hypothetical protein
MRATRIPKDQRIMLLAGRNQITRPDLLRAMYLTRWAGQLPRGGVLTAQGGLAAGCCGRYSFFRVRIWLHRHPGDRPVPADMRAALDGTGPVPEWFTKGGPPPGTGDTS